MSSQVTNCRNCGTENPQGTKFCRNCGSAFQALSLNLQTPVGQSSQASIAGMVATSLVCQRCGFTNLTDARFCEGCGAKMVAQPKATTSPAPTPLPLFTVPVNINEDNIRSQGEAAKVGLFGLVGKRTLIGKKPEEYIVLESMVWTDKVYVRVHGIYSSTYVVDVVYPLDVGDDTIEVEVVGPNKLAPQKGTLKLATRLRKVIRNETTVYYDERSGEVQVELPPKTALRLLRTVRPPRTDENMKQLLETTLDWAKKEFQVKIGKLPVSGATIERENLNLSDHEIILVPYCLLTFVNSKTGEKKSLTFDSLRGGLIPTLVGTR